MTEQTYYNVWYTVEGNEVEVMGNKISVDVMDLTELGIEKSFALNEQELEAVLNIEWDMKKSSSFIKKLAKKIESQLH